MVLSIVVEKKYIIGDINKDLIGKGSFGNVYAGKNRNTGDDVAIKLEKSGENTLLKHEAQIYAVVAKVSQLKGLIIRVIGSSFIISIAINIPTSNTEFFKYGICILVNVFNFE